MSWRISAAAFTFFCAVPAFAADLPTYKSPIAPTPVQPAIAWGGFYVGGFAGGNWSRVTQSDIPYPNQDIPTLNADGPTVGGLAGYNFQFNALVAGVEGELGYDKRSAGATYQAINGTGARLASDFGDVEGRLRARIGYSLGSVLLYVSGGGTLSNLELGETTPATDLNSQINYWRVGLNVGGGLEWAFNPHWTLRAEYIYDSFGSRLYPFGSQPIRFPYNDTSARLQESTARVAIAYKF